MQHGHYYQKLPTKDGTNKKNHISVNWHVWALRRLQTGQPTRSGTGSHFSAYGASASFEVLLGVPRGQLYKPRAYPDSDAEP